MATTPKLMTAEDLWHLPDAGQRRELVAGELRTMSPGGAERGRIEIRLASSPHQQVLAHDLGEVFGAETGFLLTRDPDTLRAPDAVFVSRERADAVGDVTGYWPGAPDLAVEVISPNDAYSEIAEKVDTWLAHGARIVIVVDPRRRTIAVHRSPTAVRHLTIDDTLDGEDVVPGWKVSVRDVFVRITR